MNPDLSRRLLATGRLAVPDKLGEWNGGPLVCDGHRDIEGQDRWRDPDTGVLWRWVDGAWLPDLDDESGATLGVALRVLRTELRDPSLSTRCRKRLRVEGDADSGWTVGPWGVVSTSAHVTISIHGSLADTEPAALVAALEAACRT